MLPMALSLLGGFGPKTPEVAPVPPKGLHALIVGGGPDLEHNQVAIESNVRYVDRLLPDDAQRRILFTDGNPKSKNVLFEGKDSSEQYRAPQLPRLDGPAQLDNVKTEIASLAKRTPSGAPVLLYFTGHGSPNQASGFHNNTFDLWNKDELSVKDLATSLNSFPKSTPITLVMVECFSGAFGNVLFENGDPEGALANRNICGFFASVNVRMAAGCTPEVNEANYHDFTGYFFAALTGTDRLGKPVTGADYNKDGKVGMNEAFVYTLINDESIDTPVCTTDVFLRRFIKTEDKAIFETPYSDVKKWATPAQVAGLDAMSKTLNLSGEDRLQTAYNIVKDSTLDSADTKDVYGMRFIRLAKSVVLAHQLQSSGDPNVKSRYAALVKAENGRPW